MHIILARATSLILLFAAISLCQGDKGTIVGSLTDTTGAAIPDAAIQIRNEATGVSTPSASNETGRFVSTPLPPGPYEVVVEKQGFRKSSSSINLVAGSRAIADFSLQVGSTQETVEVVSKAELLQSETSTLNTSNSSRELRDLPINGRNFATFVTLTAGAAPVYGAGVRNQGHMQTNFNGIGFRANRWKIDGLDNTENHNGQAIVGHAPMEAIEEIQTQTSVAPAEYGGGGANVNVVMRSGTQKYHGTLFHFLRNSALDARNFFALEQPHLVRNQFGGVLGGPIQIGRYNRDRTKTFFFVDYEGLRQSQATTAFATVPTAAFKRGDFSQAANRLYNPTTTVSGAQGSVRSLFPGNVIPSSLIDSVGRNIINTYPDPNRPGFANNYASSPRQTDNTNNFDVKIDHNFSERSSAFFRFTRQNFDRVTEAVLPAPAGGSTLDRGPHLSFVGSHTFTISPNLVNEVRGGLGRLDLRAEQTNRGVNVNDQLGIPNVNRGDDPLYSGMSQISLSGYTEIGGSGFSPSSRQSTNWQVSDNLSWHRGAHSYKFGFELIGRRYNLLQTTAARGAYSVTGGYTQNLIASTGTGDAAADLLLGAPNNATYAPLGGFRYFRRPELSLYAQDDWKVTRSLSLNYGLRYDAFINFPWVETQDRQSNFLPELGRVVVVNTPELPQRSGSYTDWNNIGPRFGLAYKLGGFTAIRSAYGIFYSSESTPQTNLPGANPPFVGSVGITNDQTNFAGASRFRDGLPPARPVGEYPTLGGRIYAVDRRYKIPYAQQWNFSIQRQLPSDTVLSLAYVGTKSTHNMLEPNLNQPRPGPGSIVSRRPYPAYQDIDLTQGAGSSTFHSLQITTDKRMANGVAWQLSYVWSKWINDGEFVSGRQNYNDLRSEKALGSYDMRHRFIGAVTWELPFGRGRRFLANSGNVAEVLAGGWMLNTVSTIHSGMPFTVNSGINTLNIGGGTQRADRLRDGVLPESERTLQRYFDVTAFAVPRPFTFGNSGRNILTGPGTLQFDLSATKSFPLGADSLRRIQFRAEAFNLANTPQFNTPDSTIGRPTAGVINSAGSPSTFQRTQRQLQLALKLYF